MIVHVVLVTHADRTSWVNSVWADYDSAQQWAHKIEADSQWVGADVETHHIRIPPAPLPHFEVGWACACGWEPDYQSSQGLGLQQQHHMENNK